MRNTICVEGNLGRKPEAKTIGDNREIVKASLAVSLEWKKGAPRNEQPDSTWFDLTAWNDMPKAVLLERDKGERVCVMGGLSAWTGDKGGQRLQINVEAIMPVPKMKKAAAPAKASSPDKAMQGPLDDGGQVQVADLDDDIPF